MAGNTTEYTLEMLALLEAQREYFASDDHIRREVEPWRAPLPRSASPRSLRCAPPATTSCRGSIPKTLERVLPTIPLPDDTIKILMALRQSSAG